jgi:hypothetical protein
MINFLGSGKWPGPDARQPAALRQEGDAPGGH